MKMMLLENRENWCYINASIQLLDDLNIENKRSRHKPKDRPTRMLLQLLKNRNVNNELAEVLKMYYRGVQSDADEFLKTMLDLLSTDNYIDINVSEMTYFLVSNPPRYQIVKVNKLPMNTIDIFINDCKSMQDCLDKSQDEIDELETGNYNYTHKKIAYEPTGKDLIITLKRYDYNGVKLQQKIIPDKVITFKKSTYYLKGCILHLGRDLTSGHYTYLTFDDNGEPETYISDDTVQQYKKNGLNDFLKNGYIYLYKKVGSSREKQLSRKKIRKRRPTVVQHLLKSQKSQKKKSKRYSGSIKRY
jgi:uncharacterized UBP type Zn finger protein